ncbi:MAG: tetratricopeptide repeat protein [Thermodesulfobacteriota bacterium]|nr:tetratricopeptide repeat protein [Thermodesulfobacteriota bacterium]
MVLSRLSKMGCIYICLSLFFITGCGEYFGLSWEECFEKGKIIKSDTSIPKEKRFAGAEEAYLVALRKLEKALDKKQVQTKDMRELFNEIEILFRNQTKYAELEPILKKKVELYEKYLGGDKILTGAAHENLGHLYKQLKRNQDAVFEYQLAMRIYETQKRESGVERIQNLIQTLN